MKNWFEMTMEEKMEEYKSYLMEDGEQTFEEYCKDIEEMYK